MAGDDPPYLVVGTEVSAKYRGAFCEAKVKKLVKCVKCKIFLKETQSSLLVTDDVVKGILKNGSIVEVKNPETGMLTEGVITRLTDSSMYTVVFNDGDEKTLRRTQLCLKGEKHFIESETLDNLPLSHPEHFGTPVMHSKSGKRGGRHSMGNNEEDDTSSDESIPKRAAYKGRLQNLVGKVMLAEMGDKRKQQVPVLVVLPDAHTTELRTKDHLLIKSFKDGKFYSIARKDMKEFTKDTVQKNEDKTLKAAFEKCIAYYDNQDLPTSWERDELLGTDEEEITDDEESSDDEPSEEKDRFVAQLYKFMDDRGTPINKGPTLGNKDLNLYKLFKVVQNIGGYNKVTNQLKWRGVYAKMSLPPSNTASHQIKNAYKKYLHAFEDFYRKLGSSMGTISRPGRSRSHSGRGIHVPFKKEPEKKDKTPLKREDGKETDEKPESDTGEIEGIEPLETVVKRERSPVKRIMRHETTPKTEEKVKKEEVNVQKEKKVEKDDSTPKKIVKKEPVKKDPDSAKKTAKTVKKEREEEKKAKKEMLAEQQKEKANEEKEKTKEKIPQEKKIVRRRSMRKDEKDMDTKDDDNCKEEETKKEKPADKETKPKAKLVNKDEKKDKKEEKKEEKKEVKVTRKEMKKAAKAEEEAMEIEKPKSVKKEGKKAKVDDDGSESDKPKGTQKKETKKEDHDGEGGSSKKDNKDSRTEKSQDDDEDSGEIESDKKWSEEVESKTDINAEFPNGTRLQVRYGRGRNQKVYDAKVVEAGLDSSQVQYLVHYAGWNMRYDEWIKPERIVNVINRPDSDKKVKDCSPKSSKQQLQMINKKRGRPGPSPVQPSPPKTAAVAEPRPAPVKARSPASSTKPKSRPTRSNSVEFKVMDGLPPKWRRTRRNSGVTESDVNSQGSDFEDFDQSDLDADEKEMSASSPEMEDLEKDMSVDSFDEEEDKEKEKDVDAPLDMPTLEMKADEPELPILKEIKDISEEPKSKAQSSKSTTLESTPAVVTTDQVDAEEQHKDKPESDPMESAPQLEAVEDLPATPEPADQESSSSENDSDKLKKDVFKWDIEEEVGESATTKEVVAEVSESSKESAENTSSNVVPENTEIDDDMPPVIAPVLEKQVDNKEVLNVDIDKPAPEIRPEVIKAEKQQEKVDKVAPANNVFDKYEFRDDEEEITLPDLRAEAEKELKEKLKQEAVEMEKRITKGKKKEIKEKKDCKEKEKKEVKKGKMTMAERKMVILPEGTPEVEYEPPQKKAKEDKPPPTVDKVIEASTETAMSTLDKVISSVCDKAREFVMEETEGEKKKVKKKVKKKEAEVSTPDVKKEMAKKETGKSLKPVKSEKVPNKGKGKKSKEIGEGELEQSVDSSVCASVKAENKNESAMSPSLHDTGSDKTKAVINPSLDSNLQMLSGVELLSGIALMNANEVISGRMDYIDPSKEASNSSAVNTVLDNTPPTTPEHDDSDGAQCASRDHSSSQESQNKSDIDNSAENEQQSVGGESPHGNASPSSNDGSVGSGNVACSESSNLDVPVSSNLGKRKKESEEPTPTKKKRKGKSKVTSERKTSKPTGSDSDEGNEGGSSQDPPSSNSKSSSHSSGAAHSPRPSRYNLNLEEGKYLEGEKRIAFLMEKIQEIRKVYMNLKAEVACIDRRRKRARRKESVQHSSTAAETEYCR